MGLNKIYPQHHGCDNEKQDINPPKKEEARW